MAGAGGNNVRSAGSSGRSYLDAVEADDVPDLAHMGQLSMVRGEAPQLHAALPDRSVHQLEAAHQVGAPGLAGGIPFYNNPIDIMRRALRGTPDAQQIEIYVSLRGAINGCHWARSHGAPLCGVPSLAISSLCGKL